MYTKPTQPLLINFLPEDRAKLAEIREIVKEKTDRSRGGAYFVRAAVRFVHSDPKLMRRLIKQVQSEPKEAVVE